MKRTSAQWSEETKKKMLRLKFLIQRAKQDPNLSAELAEIVDYAEQMLEASGSAVYAGMGWPNPNKEAHDAGNHENCEFQYCAHHPDWDYFR